MTTSRTISNVRWPTLFCLAETVALCLYEANKLPEWPDLPAVTSDFFNLTSQVSRAERGQIQEHFRLAAPFLARLFCFPFPGRIAGADARPLSCEQALALLLVFRTDASYNRWSEARECWGAPGEWETHEQRQSRHPTQRNATQCSTAACAQWGTARLAMTGCGCIRIRRAAPLCRVPYWQDEKHAPSGTRRLRRGRHRPSFGSSQMARCVRRSLEGAASFQGWPGWDAYTYCEYETPSS